MRTTDQQTLIQQQLKQTGGGIQTPTQQFAGLYDANILDTDITNTKVPSGQCRVVIPVLSPNFAFGPCPYPGSVAPPDGTPCVAGFLQALPNETGGLQVRVLNLEGFGGSGGEDLIHPFLLMGA